MLKVTHKKNYQILISSLILGFVLIPFFSSSSAFATAKIQTSTTNVTAGETFTLSVQIYGAAWDVSVYTTGPTDDCSLHGVDFSPNGDNTDYTYTRTCTATSAGTITAVLSGLVSYADLNEVPVSGNVSIAVMTPPDPTPVKPSIPEDVAPPPLTTTETEGTPETPTEETAEEEIEDETDGYALPLGATLNHAADTRRTFTSLTSSMPEDDGASRPLIILTIIGLAAAAGLVTIVIIAKKQNVSLKPEIKPTKPSQKLNIKNKIKPPRFLKALSKKKNVLKRKKVATLAKTDGSAEVNAYVTQSSRLAEARVKSPQVQYQNQYQSQYHNQHQDQYQNQYQDQYQYQSPYQDQYQPQYPPQPYVEPIQPQSESLIRRFSDPNNKISRSEVEALYYYPSPSLLVPNAPPAPDEEAIKANKARGYNPMPEMKNVDIPNPFDLGIDQNIGLYPENYNQTFASNPDSYNGNLNEEAWNFHENLSTEN